MGRIVKSHDDRRNELLDVADHLFSTKGFSATTINDIINEIGIDTIHPASLLRKPDVTNSAALKNIKCPSLVQPIETSSICAPR